MSPASPVLEEEPEDGVDEEPEAEDRRDGSTKSLDEIIDAYTG